MRKEAFVPGHCACARPKTTNRSSPWRALPPVVVAALMPKCPMCLFGLLTALGATGLERAMGLDPRVLLAFSVMMLALVVVWFALRRGLIGAVAALLASVVIFCGKHIFSSTALVVCGLATLAIYVLGESLICNRTGMDAVRAPARSVAVRGWKDTGPIGGRSGSKSSRRAATRTRSRDATA